LVLQIIRMVDTLRQRGEIKMGTKLGMNLRGKWGARGIYAALVAVLLLASNSLCSASGSTGLVITQNGLVRGVQNGSIDQFLGIPYAAPPVGKLRWLPPQPHGPWRGVLNAADFGSVCTQRGSQPGEVIGSEDCLFLNVYRPHPRFFSYKGRLPVMVWIHGGALAILSGDFDDPPALLNGGNVIIVSMNYRLGTLGFFAHPSIDAEGHLNANYGLMDQQFALKWVRANIAGFGGDPSRVAIFGTSAGALSVYSQLASPTAAGLFQRAISQSGSYQGLANYQTAIVPISTAEAAGVALARNFGCTTATCLRNIPAPKLVAAQPGEFFPIIDGTVLRQKPVDAFTSGRFNRVPVITGMSHDDYRFVVAIEYDFGPGPLTVAQYPGAIANLLDLPQSDPFVATVLDLYPLSNYGNDPSIALGAAGTDRVDACPALIGDNALSQYTTTYAYEFSDETAPSFFDRPVSFPLGAYHSSEVLYLLRTDLLNSAQLQLSKTWIGYWTQFAAKGNPNLSGAPGWPRFQAGTLQVQSMLLPGPKTVDNFASDHRCSFWTP
jgi:para-nitrobenzyl esterase